jgi:hypothetical protein
MLVCSQTVHATILRGIGASTANKKYVSNYIATEQIKCKVITSFIQQPVSLKRENEIDTRQSRSYID